MSEIGPEVLWPTLSVELNYTLSKVAKRNIIIHWMTTSSTIRTYHIVITLNQQIPLKRLKIISFLIG